MKRGKPDPEPGGGSIDSVPSRTCKKIASLPYDVVHKGFISPQQCERIVLLAEEHAMSHGKWQLASTIDRNYRQVNLYNCMEYKLS